MELRTITIDDYEKLIEFWKIHYFVTEMDSLDRFKLFLEKNPDLSFLAEENGVVVGTILGSFDGRRGYLQKLVVDSKSRKKGIGKQLVEKVIEKFRDLGVLYIPLNVEEELIPFYEKCGFKKTSQHSMSLSF